MDSKSSQPTLPGVVVDRPTPRILRVGLDRPHRANALDDKSIDAIHDALSEASADPECHCILLHSRNKFFCAGFDMTGYDGDPDSQGGAAAVVAKMDRLAELPLRMRSARQVVIAAVRGPAIGAGFALALGADVLVAGESATFQLPQTAIGLPAAEMGISFLLPRIVGLNRASDIMLRACEVTARDAVAAGLVAQVHPDAQADGAALDLAQQLAQRSGKALSSTKRMLLAAVQSNHLEHTTQAETRAQVLSNYWPEPRAAIAAFTARRRIDR